MFGGIILGGLSTRIIKNRAPTHVNLSIPMHRTCGRIARPPPGVTGLKGCTPAGSPATPEASRLGVRHSPRLSAATAAAAATTAASAVSAAHNTDDVDICADESQLLLSPPPCLVTKSYVCDWAQAIQCTLTNVEPAPCQREGCGILVHHITFARVSGNRGRATGILSLVFVAFTTLIINIGVPWRRLTWLWRQLSLRHRVLSLRQRW